MIFKISFIFRFPLINFKTLAAVLFTLYKNDSGVPIGLLVFVLQPALFVAKASVVVLFIITSAVLSVITLEDLNAVAQEAKVTLQRSRT